MGRRSIWSNEKVIELAKQFVPATDEVYRLQKGTDPECLYFQKLADKGHYRRQGSSRQGIYVCTPSGQLLGSLNSHNVETVIKMMEKGLDRYQSLSPDERKLSADAEIRPAHRWENSLPERGLNLTIQSRDLPKSGDASADANPKWNQDHVWFSQQEAGQFLPADPTNRIVGFEHDVPGPIISRLIRFGLVDVVKGQTSHFSKSDVGDFNMIVRIESVNESVVSLTIRGKTFAESSNSRYRSRHHGVQTKLLGSATYDLKKSSFSAFELLALGTRWGRTVYNGRRRELDKSAIGYVIRLTPEEAPVIAPAFLGQYNADWVIRP